jgi:hypothetical protein
VIQKCNSAFFYDNVGSGSAAKLPRFSYHVVLESESDLPTDEDEESLHSVQGRETGLYIISYFSN